MVEEMKMDVVELVEKVTTITFKDKGRDRKCHGVFKVIERNFLRMHTNKESWQAKNMNLECNSWKKKRKPTRRIIKRVIKFYRRKNKTSRANSTSGYKGKKNVQ